MDISRRTILSRAAAASSLTLVPASRAFARAAPPHPFGAVPSPRQLAWQAMELNAFVHFSLNTFTGREWGYGDESPSLFDPTDFDAGQIARVAKAGGMRGLILTAKHHDGFCLWPSRFTEHSIRNSPYRDGKGDILRELSEACRREGLGFGVYLSPWDRNRADYGTPSYIDYYRNQLRELMSDYGPIFEVWFDGANGGDGYYGGAREKRAIDASRYYDWPNTWKIVRELQPKALVWGPEGSDARWIGNEDGVAGDPCWATMDEGPYTQEKGQSGIRGGAVWWPAEVDVSIRPGWFWHEHETDQVKSPGRLLHLYLESVGRGANLLLNLPPDRRGRIPEPDERSLTGWGDMMRATFAKNLAGGARAAASAIRGGDQAYDPANVLDGRPDSYWSTDDSVKDAILTLDLPVSQRFDLIRLREYLPLGLRVGTAALEVERDGVWTEIGRFQGIGSQRLVRLPEPISAPRIRLRVIEAAACPAISEFGLFLLPVLAEPTAIVHDRSGGKAGWRVVEASAPGAQAVIDESASSVWSAALPARLVVDLGESHALKGFTVQPALSLPPQTGAPADYRFSLSEDGKAWGPPVVGEFSNIAANHSLQRITFPEAMEGRYLRLEISRSAGEQERIAFTELGVLTR